MPVRNLPRFKNGPHGISTLTVALFIAIPLTLQAQESAQRLFESWDRNGDGVLVITEVPIAQRYSFSGNDRNNDGKVTLAEHIDGAKRAATPRTANSTGNTTRFTINQTWHQQPDGFEREVYVLQPQKTNKKPPVVIFFHGNGGMASGALGRFRYLGNVLLVAPQGYERSWNIHGERSEAPDVEFVRRLLKELPRRFPNADYSNVTLIGSSNGAGLLYRLMIEMDEKPFKRVIMLVASMVTQQYHENSFWKPSRHTRTYDVKVEPTTDPELIYFHGTNDKVVPYYGGLRGRFPHLSAQETIFRWAQAYGYQGKQLKDSDSRTIAQGIQKYDYLDGRLLHYKLQGAGHGPGKYGPFVNRIIREAIFH